MRILVERVNDRPAVRQVLIILFFLGSSVLLSRIFGAIETKFTLYKATVNGSIKFKVYCLFDFVV